MRRSVAWTIRIAPSPVARANVSARATTTRDWGNDLLVGLMAALITPGVAVGKPEVRDPAPTDTVESRIRFRLDVGDARLQELAPMSQRRDLVPQVGRGDGIHRPRRRLRIEGGVGDLDDVGLPEAAGSDATHEVEEGRLVHLVRGAGRLREEPAHQPDAPTRWSFGEFRRVCEVERVEDETQDALRLHDLDMALGLRRVEVDDEFAGVGRGSQIALTDGFEEDQRAGDVFGRRLGEIGDAEPDAEAAPQCELADVTAAGLQEVTHVQGVAFLDGEAIRTGEAAREGGCDGIEVHRCALRLDAGRWNCRVSSDGPVTAIPRVRAGHPSNRRSLKPRMLP